MSNPATVAGNVKPVKRRVSWGARWTAIGGILFVFFVSCCLPGLYFLPDAGGAGWTWWGFVILVMGWTGVFVGQFAWFANLFLFAGWVAILCRWWIVSVVLSVMSILIALDTYAMVGQQLPMDEGGVNHDHMTGIGPAFYVWLASMLVTVGCAFLLRMRDRKLRQVVAV